jgi:hypothetical protein
MLQNGGPALEMLIFPALRYSWIHSLRGRNFKRCDSGAPAGKPPKAAAREKLVPFLWAQLIHSVAAVLSENHIAEHTYELSNTFKKNVSGTGDGVHLVSGNGPTL